MRNIKNMTKQGKAFQKDQIFEAIVKKDTTKLKSFLVKENDSNAWLTVKPPLLQKACENELYFVLEYIWENEKKKKTLSKQMIKKGLELYFVESAVKLGNIPMLESIFNNGVALEKINRLGLSVLLWAADSLQWDTIKYIVENDLEPEFLRVIIKRLIEQEETKILMEFLKWDILIDKLHEQGISPLDWAISFKKWEMVKKLIQSDLELEIAREIIFLFVQDNKIEEVKNLLKAGIDINITNEEGENLITFAAAKKRWKMVEWLIDQKIDLNFRDSRGKSVIYYAISEQKFDIAQKMLNKGVIFDDDWVDTKKLKQYKKALNFSLRVGKKRPKAEVIHLKPKK